MRDANRLRRLVGSRPAPAGVSEQAHLPGGVGHRPGALRPPAGSRLTPSASDLLRPPLKARPDADKTPDGAPQGAARSQNDRAQDEERRAARRAVPSLRFSGGQKEDTSGADRAARTMELVPMNAENDPINQLYERTLRAANMMLDALERQLAPPSPPRQIPFSDDPGVRAARRWLSDQFALWLFCDNANCLRARCCRGRHVACYRYEMDRVPDDVGAGLDVWVKAYSGGIDAATLRGERGKHIAAFMDWRLRFGLDALPTRESLVAAARARLGKATLR